MSRENLCSWFVIVLMVHFTGGTFLVVSNNNPVPLPELPAIPTIQLPNLKLPQIQQLQGALPFQQLTNNLAALKAEALERKLQFLNSLNQQFSQNSLPVPSKSIPVSIPSPIAEPCSCSSDNSEAIEYSPIVHVSSSSSNLEPINALNSLVPAAPLNRLPQPELPALNIASSFQTSKLLPNLVSNTVLNASPSLPSPTFVVPETAFSSRLTKNPTFLSPPIEISKEATVTFNSDGTRSCNCDRFENLEIATLKHKPSKTLSVLNYGIEVPSEVVSHQPCRHYSYEIEKVKPQRQNSFDILQGRIDRIIEPNTDCCQDEESKLVLGVKSPARGRRFLFNLPSFTNTSGRPLNIFGPMLNNFSPISVTFPKYEEVSRASSNNSSVMDLVKSSMTRIDIPKHYDPVIRQEPLAEPAPYTHMEPGHFHHLSDLLQKSTAFSLQNEGNFISPPPSTQMKEVLQLLIDLFESYKNDIPEYRSSSIFTNPLVDTNRIHSFTLNERHSKILSLLEVQQLMKNYHPTESFTLPPRRPDRRYQFIDQMAQVYKYKSQNFPIRQLLEPLYNVLTWQAQREVQAEKIRQQVISSLRAVRRFELTRVNT